MSRVQVIQEAEASLEVKEIYHNIKKNRAKVLNLYRVLAHNPKILLNFLRLGNSLLVETELSPKLRELAILRVARLAGSEYEWTQHCPIALELGITNEQIQAISYWSTSIKFSDLERAVLQYTDEVAQAVEVKDGTFKALRQYLSERAIVELTVSIGYWGMVARVLVPLQIDIDTQSIGSARELTGW